MSTCVVSVNMLLRRFNKFPKPQIKVALSGMVRFGRVLKMLEWDLKEVVFLKPYQREVTFKKEIKRRWKKRGSEGLNTEQR